jgi:hypothetical protein
MALTTVPAYQAQGPEFKSQICSPKNSLLKNKSKINFNNIFYLIRYTRIPL